MHMEQKSIIPINWNWNRILYKHISVLTHIALCTYVTYIEDVRLSTVAEAAVPKRLNSG